MIKTTHTLQILALFFVLASCSDQKHRPVATNAQLDSVFRVADRLSDSGMKKESLALVTSAYKTFSPLSLTDHINYFSYCNIIYNKNREYSRSIGMADSMMSVLDNTTETKHPEITKWRIVAYNMKADALFAKGMYNDAYNYYNIAQILAVNNQDSCSMRTYSYSLAMTLYRQQRYQQSAQRFAEAYYQAGACPEDFNNFYFRQEMLDNIGLCYNAVGKYDSALYYYRKAMEYLNASTGKFENKLPNVYEAPKAVVYGNMAEVYMHQGRFDSAKVLYEHSININLQKGYTNSDAIVNQVKLADLYFKTGDVQLSKITLDRVKAELDTLPDSQVEMLWNKLMWKYSEHTRDSLKAYRHLRLYTLLNENYISANKALMETDLDMRVKDLEKQYRINLLIEDKKQQKTYLTIVTILAVMSVVILFLILRNAYRSKQNIKLLTNLNNTVNEQKRKLEVALEELKVQEKDKTRILNSVAHDVMNPIAAIVSLTDILLYEQDNYTAEQLEVINLIKEASNNSINLSKDILEAAENTINKTLTKERTDINQLVARSVELLCFGAQSKKQTIVPHMPSQTVYANIYKDKMRRVINNILGNAIKFSHEGSKIDITLTQEGGNVHIAVRDYGIGIPEQNKAHVFDMFTDVKLPGTSGEVAHGLGLSISLQIVRAHNGDIWLESELGKGTTFHIVFPVGG